MSDREQINSTNAIAAAWDNLADAYKDAVTDIKQRKLAVEIELAAFEQVLPPGRLNILDAGCGVGSHGRKLLRRRHRITFADVSERMLQLAEELTPQTYRSRATFLQCDIRMLDNFTDNSFDAVISGGTVVSDCGCPEDAIANIRRVLRPTGLCGFSVRNLHSPLRPGKCESVLRGAGPGFDWYFFDPHSLNELCSRQRLRITKIVPVHIVPPPAHGIKRCVSAHLNSTHLDKACELFVLATK